MGHFTRRTKALWDTLPGELKHYGTLYRTTKALLDTLPGELMYYGTLYPEN
jgi:hypothetical protein